MTQTLIAALACHLSQSYLPNMQAGAEFPIMLAFLNGMELFCVLAIILILFGRKYLDDLRRGFGRGVFHFGKALDDQAEELGRSVGVNYAKPALDALTHDNQAIEFHDQREHGRVSFRRWRRRAKNWLLQFCRSTWTWISKTRFR
jgi:Sec-independent protein translocase protein TatA